MSSSPPLPVTARPLPHRHVPAHLNLLEGEGALLPVVEEGDGLVGVHRPLVDGGVGRALRRRHVDLHALVAARDAAEVRRRRAGVDRHHVGHLEK